MAKINFKQPKFIIPLILFPFLILGYFVFSTFKSKGNKAKMTMEDSMAIVREKGLNTDMPKVSNDVSSSGVKDKFGAYSDAYKNQKDYSALNSIDNLPTEDRASNNSSYSNADVQRLESNRRLDSMKRSLEKNRAIIQQRINGFSNPAKMPARQRNAYGNPADQSAEIMEVLRSNQNSYGSQQPTWTDQTTNKKPVGGTYDDQMRFFRDQIRMVDSMQKANKTLNAKPADKIGDADLRDLAQNKFDPSKDTTFRPLHVSAVDQSQSEGSGFNTIKKFRAEENIRAVIDEAKKVTAGARVRIRLLQDIFVGETILPAGTFIYGIVTGFQTQRINITITSINQDGKPLPVKLDVFDSDGYLGLYVPGSNFREFSKDVGTQSTSGLSQIQTSNGTSNDIQTSIMSKVFQSTTNTVGKLISQNKATLKADYIIYLKENRSSSNKF